MAVMLLRNSERQTFKKCRHRWQWTYLDGRESREAPTALRFGDLAHQALAAYYKPGRKRGPHPARTFERLYHEQAKALADEGFDVFTDEKWEPALDLGIRMLEGYVERYRDADAEFTVIASEQTFQLPLTTVLADGRRVRFKIVGTFDGVWRHLSSKRLVFKEFKTAAAIQTDGLPMDEQAGTYWTYGPRWLRRAGLLKEGESISSILYTFLRKAAPDPNDTYDEEGRRLNKDGAISKRQPAPYFERIPVYRDRTDRERMHARVLMEAAEVYAARHGELPLYKNPGPLYMPNCRGCPVREACELHEVGGDYQATLDATTRPWNAYAAHELIERH